MPRSWLRMCMATAHPPPSSPTMRSAGTCTSSNTTSASSSVPFACSIGDTSTPGERRSTMNAVRPRWRSSGVPVRASTRHHVAYRAQLVQILRPSMTKPSPSRRARGAQAGQVGAGVGLGEALGPELAAGEERRQRLGDERPRAEGHERRAPGSRGARTAPCPARRGGPAPPTWRRGGRWCRRARRPRRPAVPGPPRVEERGHEAGHRLDPPGVVGLRAAGGPQGRMDRPPSQDSSAAA